MPTHKGIELSIISQIGLKAHPEFPHPECSQFTYRSPGAYQSPDGYSPEVRKGNRANDWTPPSASSDSKADRLLGRQTNVSVYIPSAIGARFWIHYNVLEPEALQAQWFYFKLFMNGRHITSWGINAITNPEGQVMRGLFEPSSEFNYENADGTIMEKGGAESRPFFFGPGPEPGEPIVAALDGGLIEVMVFRARGRRRRVQEPSFFKVQEGYGIVMPSQGLIPNPEEAKFYDWHLKDPRDNPFAVFKFHYRSWDTLKTLQLIPENHPMDSSIPTGGFFSNLIKKRQVENSSEDDSTIDESPIVYKNPWSKTPFDESPESAIKSKEKHGTYLVLPKPKNNPFSGKYSDESLDSFSSIKPPVSRFSTAQIDKPLESPWKNYLHRPLPEVPSRQSSLKNKPGHTRESSNVSSTASVTPSLQSYLDRNDTTSPDPEVGIASVLQVTTSTPSKSTEKAKDQEEIFDNKSFLESNDSTSFSKSESSVQESPCVTSTSASKRRGMSSPPPSALLGYLEYPVLTPNITIRKTRQTPNLGPLKINTKTFSGTPPALLGINNTTTISEGEWMAKSPSPVKEERSTRMWSPIPSGRKGKGKERAVVDSREFNNEIGEDDEGLVGKNFRKKALAWFEKVKMGDNEEARRSPTDEERDPLEVPNAVRPMPGNWI